jgi:hypothetical protein
MLLANDMADGLRRRLVVTGQAVRLAVRYSRDGEANVGAWTRRVRGPGRIAWTRQARRYASG